MNFDICTDNGARLHTFTATNANEARKIAADYAYTNNLTRVWVDGPAIGGWVSARAPERPKGDERTDAQKIADANAMLARNGWSLP